MDDKKIIKIEIISTRYESDESLFSEQSDGQDEIICPKSSDAKPEVTQVKTEGVLCYSQDRVELFYDETELCGMEGSHTSISFDKTQPHIITKIRTGMVSATLVFEEGQRHHCVYKTPFMPFEVCVRSIKVKNLFLSGGLIELDYIVEIRGARAERTNLSIRVF